MKRNFPIQHEFVDFVPPEREERKLYVSIKYATAVHNCFCGCGAKIVTPLSPTGWQLIFDGETVSLHPSVGNWGFPCRSHYIVRRNRVLWADDMTEKEIDAGRARDRAAREEYFERSSKPTAAQPKATPAKAGKRKKRALWGWLTGA